MRLLSATIAGSFQRVIVPPKIPATVAADNCSWVLEGKLCKTAIGAATNGMWTSVERRVVAVYAPSDIQKSPMDLSEFAWPVPEEEEA